MITRIFTVSKDKATQKAATALGQELSQGGATVRVAPFSEQPSPALEPLLQAELRQLFFFGPVTADSYGEFSASAFAERLAGEFPLLLDRQITQDIYFLGLSQGCLSDFSLAQALADALDREGFKRVTVHALASGQKFPGERAVLLNLLNQPENIFIPNEAAQRKEERLQGLRARFELEMRMRIVELIQATTDFLEDDEQERHSLAILKLLRKDLLNKPKVAWQDLCSLYFSNHQASLLPLQGLIHPLLKNLSAGLIPSLQYSPVGKSEAVTSRTISYHDSEEKSTSLNPSRLFSGSIEAEAIPLAIQRKLQKQINILELEIGELRERKSASYFSCFIAYELRTKMQKQSCLQELSLAKTFASLQAKARQASEDKRLNRGWHNTYTGLFWTSRTTVLLKDILNMTEEGRQQQLSR